MFSIRFLLLSIVFYVVIIVTITVVPVQANTRDMEYDELTGHLASTREEILSTRKLRKDFFGEKLDEFKKIINDHKNGIAPLNDNDVQFYERRIKLYENKLKELDMDKDPRFVDRLMAREAHLNENTRRRLLERATGEL